MDTTQTNASANFYPDPSYEYTIKSRKRFKDNYAPFGMVGVLHRKKARKDFMDIFDRINTLSKAAINIFTEIKLKTDDDTGIAVMSEWADLPSGQRRVLNRRLTELRNIDLVLKIRALKENKTAFEKYSYMINPHLMKPYQYTTAKELWKAVKLQYNK